MHDSSVDNMALRLLSASGREKSHLFVDDTPVPDDVTEESQHTRVMNNRISRIYMLSSLSAVFGLPLTALPQTQTPLVQSAPIVEAAPEVKLPYGIEDIVKLSRAQVSDDVIIKYIQNSGTIYTLTPKEIVYLRDQGVSDRVVHAMLDQRRNVTEATAQVTSEPAPQVAPVYAPPPAASYEASAPAQAQSTPMSVPASSVYVIPYPTTYQPYVYYGYSRPYYYPYYGYYGGYLGPYAGFRFGYGGHYHYHYHHH
jgi:hypothetical protein